MALKTPLFGTCLMLVCQSHVLGWTPGTSEQLAVDGFLVDTLDRMDVLGFYNTVYRASEDYESSIGWTGSTPLGVAGTTTLQFREDVRRRVNFYRALAGIPSDIRFNDAKGLKCRQAALMFSANSAISHFPPTTWTYYSTAGAEAASMSNIGWGSYGATSIDRYMFDRGDNNVIVGHRRWVLYPKAQEMATGNVSPNGGFPAGNALWVIGNFKPAASPKKFVPWPNAGFTPQNLIPERWSLTFPGADFSKANVTMSRSGTALPLVVTSRTATDLGENTLVWEPSGLPITSLRDLSYDVSVTGIEGVGVPTSTTYQVISFNPGVLNNSITITGPTDSIPAGTNYQFNTIDQSDGYQLRVSTGIASLWSEGGETMTRIVGRTAADYPLTQTLVKRDGTHAFHLAFPNRQAGEQGFEIARDIIPSPASNLVFHDLFRYSTTTSRLSAEVSTDNGLSWAEIWGRNGNGDNNQSGWDQMFSAHSVSLAAYAGKPVNIRFVYRFDGYTYLQTTERYGIFLDDISVTDGTELKSVITTLPAYASGFSLNETTAGERLGAGKSYYLRIRPNVGTRWFSDGPMRVITIPPEQPADSPEIVIQQPAGRNLANGKSRITFGKIRIGKQRSMKLFKVINSGTAKLSEITPKLSGKNRNDFTITKTVATNLQPGANTTIKVIFNPKGKGPRRATMAIVSNDADENPFRVEISGTGN
jgi:Abnormal spindle-like microcephaly-assoc'd, ASPM-SPD-2-Hydin